MFFCASFCIQLYPFSCKTTKDFLFKYKRLAPSQSGQTKPLQVVIFLLQADHSPVDSQRRRSDSFRSFLQGQLYRVSCFVFLQSAFL